MMDCPLINQGPYTFAFRFGAERAKYPADQISVYHSLDQSHDVLQPLIRGGDWADPGTGSPHHPTIPFSAANAEASSRDTARSSNKSLLFPTSAITIPGLACFCSSFTRS